MVSPPDPRPMAVEASAPSPDPHPPVIPPKPPTRRAESKKKKKKKKTPRKSARPVGRPRKPVDVRQVRKLAEIGCTYEEIAAVVGVHKSQISRSYATHVKEGHERLRTTMRRAQIKAAKAGSAVLLIWLGKILLGQRDPGAGDVRRPDEIAAFRRALDVQTRVESDEAPADSPAAPVAV